MGVVVRQSVKSVIITVLGAALGMVVTVLSVRYFSKMEYGFTQNLQKITAQLSFLALFGFNYAVLIQSQHYPPGHPKRSAFLTLSALVPVILTLIITGILFLFRNELVSLYRPEDRAMMLKFFITFPILNALTAAIMWLSGYLQGIQKNALQNLGVEIILRVGYIALIIGFALNRLNYTQFIYGFLVANLIPLIYLYWIARKLGNLRFSLKIDLPVSEIREVVRFSGYHMLTGISSVLIFQLDAILLGAMPEGGLKTLAVYSVAALAVSLLRNPTRVIATAAIPSFSKHYLSVDLKGLKTLFERSCVVMQILAFGALAFIVLDLDFIRRIVLFINEGYGAVNWLLLILMLGQVADMVTGFNYQIISISKYYRFNFWISFFLLLIVFVLNYFLIEDFGMYGAAWATTIGLIVFNIVKSWFVWKKLKMQPFSKKSFGVLLIAVVALGIAWLLPHTGHYYVDLIIKNVVLGGLFLGMILKFRVSTEVNDVVMNLFKNKKIL